MSEKCLVPSCLRHSTPNTYSGGLCMVCYGRAKKKVEAGETTWEDLERIGLFKRNTSDFDVAFEQLTNKESNSASNESTNSAS